MVKPMDERTELVGGERNYDNAQVVDELAAFIYENGKYHVLPTPGYLWIAHQRQDGLTLWEDKFRTKHEAYRAVLNRIIGKSGIEGSQVDAMHEMVQEEVRKGIQQALDALGKRQDDLFRKGGE